MVLSINIKSFLFSAISGVVFYSCLIYFWPYFPSFNPPFQWLLSCCAASSWFRTVIHLQDIIVNTALCIPLALLLLKISPRNVWPSVAVALLSMFLIGHYHLFSPENWGWHINKFALAWLMQLIPLSLAVISLRIKKTRETTY